MDQFLRDQNRDTILVVNRIGPQNIDGFDKSIQECGKLLGRKLKILIVVDRRSKRALSVEYPQHFKKILCTTDSIKQLEKALKPYLDNLLLVVCQGDANIPYFMNIIPHVPYLATPTTESLMWSTDKIYMRRRLRSHNIRLSPAYTVVKDTTSRTIKMIEQKVGFPLIVKPAGLGSSVLISVCYHKEELEKILKITLRKLNSVYKRRGYVVEPKVLVEQFMDGEMYSTDIYVNSRGTMYTTPLVHIQTGFKSGTGDFYGYRQMSPVMMKPYKHQAGFDVAKEAVTALALRNITAHVELMKTPNGWKVIEVGPRMGGFREFIYQQSFGIDHSLNDILIRLPMRPVVPRKSLGFSVVMKFYGNNQGILSTIKGLKKIKNLESFKKCHLNLAKGERVLFARNGGNSVIDVFMFNKKRSDLLADIHRLEQFLEIKVIEPSKPIMLPQISQDDAATEVLELSAKDENKTV